MFSAAMDSTLAWAMQGIPPTQHSLPDQPTMQGWPTIPDLLLETGLPQTLTTTARRMQAGMNLNASGTRLLDSSARGMTRQSPHRGMQIGELENVWEMR